MSKPSRILVCGGRDYTDKATVDYTLSEAHKYWFAPDICVIEGGATGADRLAREWAKYRGICVLTVFANWDVYGNHAGHIRNKWMLDFCKPDFVIAFPGGTGTANMIKQARAIPNLPVIEAEV